MYRVSKTRHAIAWDEISVDGNTTIRRRSTSTGLKTSLQAELIPTSRNVGRGQTFSRLPGMFALFCVALAGQRVIHSNHLHPAQ